MKNIGLLVLILLMSEIDPLNAQPTDSGCKSAFDKLGAEEAELKKTKLDCYDNTLNGVRMNCNGLTHREKTERLRDVNSRLVVLVEQMSDLTQNCDGNPSLALQKLGGRNSATVTSATVEYKRNRREPERLDSKSLKNRSESVKLSEGPTSF